MTHQLGRSQQSLINLSRFHISLMHAATLPLCSSQHFDSNSTYLEMIFSSVLILVISHKLACSCHSAQHPQELQLYRMYCALQKAKVCRSEKCPVFTDSLIPSLQLTSEQIPVRIRDAPQLIVCYHENK